MTGTKPFFFTFIVILLNPLLLLLYRPPFSSIERNYFFLSQMLPRKYFLSKATFVALCNTAREQTQLQRIIYLKYFMRLTRKPGSSERALQVPSTIHFPSLSLVIYVVNGQLHSRPPLGTTQPPIQWTLGLSWGESVRSVALTTHPI